MPEHPPEEDGEKQPHADVENEPEPVPQQLEASHVLGPIITHRSFDYREAPKK